MRLTLVLVTGLATVALAGCDKSTPAAGPPAQPTAVTASPTSSPPTKTSGKSGDYCTIAERIGVESGVMTNKHFIPLADETLEQFKAIVNLSLAARDEVHPVPPEIKSALDVQLKYFQALKDNDFDGKTPPPAGWKAANDAINQYGVAVCGFVFDK